MRNQFRRSNEFDKSKESKVASAKNPVAKERGFISFNAWIEQVFSLMFIYYFSDILFR